MIILGAKIQIVPVGGMISSNSRVGVHDSRRSHNSMTGGRADNSVTGMTNLRNHGRADKSVTGMSNLRNHGRADNSRRADFLDNWLDDLSSWCGCVEWDSWRAGLPIVGHNSVESVNSVSSVGHLQKADKSGQN